MGSGRGRGKESEEKGGGRGRGEGERDTYVGKVVTIDLRPPDVIASPEKLFDLKII